MKSLRGTGVALITPFNEDLSIDFDGLTRLIEHTISGGVNYLVALGTTAESATLSPQEKEAVKKHIVTVNNGHLPLVLGLGGNNTSQLLEAFNDKASFVGFDAILSVSPYYNRPSQEGIYEHFKALALATPLPIVMYNVPARTGSNMSPGTVIKLANDFEAIIGIKEAAGDIVQAMRLLKDRPKDFLVLSGDDMLALPLAVAGGDGVISVIGQGLPTAFSQMMNYGLEGDIVNANPLHYQLMPAIDLIFEEGNPAGIKSLLSHQGVCKPYVRLPLVKATQSLDQKIKKYQSAL